MNALIQKIASPLNKFLFFSGYCQTNRTLVKSRALIDAELV